MTETSKNMRKKTVERCFSCSRTTIGSEVKKEKQKKLFFVFCFLQMNEEELRGARSFQEYVALTIDPKEDSKSKRDFRKLDPVVEPDVKFYADTSSFLFPLFPVNLTFQ